MVSQRGPGFFYEIIRMQVLNLHARSTLCASRHTTLPWFQKQERKYAGFALMRLILISPPLQQYQGASLFLSRFEIRRKTHHNFCRDSRFEEKHINTLYYTHQLCTLVFYRAVHQHHPPPLLVSLESFCIPRTQQSHLSSLIIAPKDIFPTYQV